MLWLARLNAAGIVREIASDRLRGATELAERALDALALERGVAEKLLRLRPGMPLIGEAVRRALKVGVPAARRQLRAGLPRILKHAVDLLPPGGRYVVFGASGTVEAVLRAVKATRVKTFPADVALVGADAIYTNGDFVNARGTADFVRKAREARCGVFAVASEIKRIPAEIPLEKGFERVPGKLIHALLTEKGLTYPPLMAVAGVDPTWLDRGALDGKGGLGRCHPHHPGRG